MTPESQARLKIDQLLTDAGWIIQDYKQINLGASLGIAVREYPLKSGFADYLLMINRKAAGVIEAKKVGITLSGVENQSDKYSFQLPPKLNCHRKPLPFLYESTGVETCFTDNRDPDFCSRKVFSFHKPETLQEWLGQSDTLRVRLQVLPEIDTEDLRECQKEAIAGLFNSLKQNRPKALIQMATGVGKTYTSVSFIYWLIKIAGAKRVLFLVDRKNLGEQTQKEFQQYVTPDDGRKFTELYNVQLLTSNTIDPVNKVCITTIQRLYSMLRGEADFEAENEEASQFDGEQENQQPKDVVYNSQIPIETFDFIITDECHRSIYNVWRQVLEYFDAFIIGLTATPSLQTFGFFNQNLVMEYPHERAVADGVNVGYEVYRIRTQITEQGSTVQSGFYVDTRNRQTRALRWQQLDEELSYAGRQLDKSVVAIDQIRTVIRTFDNPLLRNLLKEIKTKNEQIIDTVSQDVVLQAGFDTSARDKARGTVESFQQYIEANKDEITALSMLYNQPYGQRQFTYEQIKQLANALSRPPRNLTPQKLWDAYAQLEADKVRGVGVQKLLTDIISLVRFAIEETEVLEPFSVSVEEKFQQWVGGKGFSSQQVVWLEKIKEHIITSVRIEAEDLQEMPQEAFQGNLLFGNDLMGILDELNEALAV